MPHYIVPSDLKPIAKTEQTITNSAVGPADWFTSAQLEKAIGVFLTVEIDQLRWWIDGSTPTPTSGHLISAGQSISLKSERGSKQLKLIRISGDGKVKCTLLGT